MFCRRIISSNTHWLAFCQKLPLTTDNFQTTANAENTVGKATRKKSKKKSFYSKELYDYLQNKSPEYVNFIPETLIRRGNTGKHSTRLFMVVDDHAKALASMISKELLRDSSYVIDSSPGLGFLAKELLQNGVPFVHLYEVYKNFYKAGGPLSTLLNNHPDRLKLHELNFSKIWKLALRDLLVETTQAEEYLMDIPYGQKKGKSYVQIIDFTPTAQTVRLIVYNFFYQTHLFERGRPCFYIGAPGPRWNKLIKIGGNSYSQYTVMLHLFFDMKHLGELPREVFIPWPREKYLKNDNLNTPMHIVKLIPKRNVFDILPKDDIKSFWFFLKHCLKTHKNKVLAEFEKFVPGSGVQLIQHDCGILTTFKELPPQKLLDIFKMYRSWPEYDEVMFNPSLEVKKNDEKLAEEDEESLEEFEQEQVDGDDQVVSTDTKEGDGRPW